MIDEVVKIHDRFTIEIKVGFMGKEGVSNNRFNLNTWFFVPGSLDINRHTYSKEDFYKDLKSNIRLITPVFTLKDIATGDQSPIISIKKTLKKLFEKGDEATLKEVEYQIKMFNSILKSALREDLRMVTRLTDDSQVAASVDNYIQCIQTITTKYRELENELGKITRYTKALDFFLFGDEFMSYLIESNCFKLLRFIEGKTGELKTISAPQLSDLLLEEMAYKKSHGYLTVQKDNPKNNKMLVLRHGILKKYSESELFVNTIKKEDGFLVRQFVYSLAAGISMIFATIVAFSFQKEYGNFTIPFFVALVVGYMLKDRIKELSRFYFAHKLGNKYFDVKTLISIGKDKIGSCKESFDYINNEKVPAEILKKRNRSSLLEASNKFNEEQIMLYRIQVETDNMLINKHSEYKVAGINNIVRYNIAGLTQKMDNPEVTLYTINEKGETTIEKGDKVYFLHMVLQLNLQEQKELRYYRVVLNRDGIKEIERM